MVEVGFHPARGDEDAAIDDEQVFFTSCVPTPLVDHGALGIAPHPRGAEQVPAAIRKFGEFTQMSVAPAAVRISLPARDAVFHHLRAVSH